ncbi:MAG: pyridoxal phosphate-dependent aminotransferase [Thermoplasmata archaeon]|nr:pyridoxal phosphate-dependent aminotransferase [Thermoplasmata archaeon]
MVRRTSPRRRKRSHARPSARASDDLPFPLARWVDDHEGLPFNLARSGMRGELRSVVRSFRKLPPAERSGVRRALAKALGVSGGRLVLTHGATEANTLALQFLARDLARRLGRVPSAGFVVPEYPPLLEIARLAGLRTEASARPDVTVLSDPNNPTGLRVGRTFLAEAFATRPVMLIDETYREFTPGRSWATADRAGLWCTGTFTKAYAGDEVRVGWVIAPEESAAEFARFHGVLMDGIPEHSLRMAAAVLRNRGTILAEARSIFRANRAALERRIPEARAIAAPLWFDRPGGRESGDELAHRAVTAGVLVCPGSFFGDASGVRLALTRRSFPRDLDAYLAVRAGAPIVRA